MTDNSRGSGAAIETRYRLLVWLVPRPATVRSADLTQMGLVKAVPQLFGSAIFSAGVSALGKPGTDRADQPDGIGAHRVSPIWAG
jgi:hypothetical protein